MFFTLSVQGFALEHFAFLPWSIYLDRTTLINVSVFYFISNLDVWTTKQRPSFTIECQVFMHIVGLNCRELDCLITISG
jgi:hypothetical protein